MEQFKAACTVVDPVVASVGLLENAQEGADAVSVKEWKQAVHIVKQDYGILFPKWLIQVSIPVIASWWYCQMDVSSSC